MFDSEKKSISALAIIPLAIAIVILGYYTTMFYGDMRAARIEAGFTKGMNEDLKEQFPEFQEKVVEQYNEYIVYLQSGIQYYQQFLSTGFWIEEDGEVWVKKGSLIIPPQEETSE